MQQNQKNISLRDAEVAEMVLNIMIVDDDTQTLNSLQYMLTSYGHHVTTCENSAQAMMRAMIRHYDCVITDYNIPGMDGLDLTRRLRERFPQAIIIGMSVNELSESFLYSGANDFLQKPFAPYQLAMMIGGDDILA